MQPHTDPEVPPLTDQPPLEDPDLGRENLEREPPPPDPIPEPGPL